MLIPRLNAPLRTNSLSSSSSQLTIGCASVKGRVSAASGASHAVQKLGVSSAHLTGSARPSACRTGAAHIVSRMSAFSPLSGSAARVVDVDGTHFKLCSTRA